MGCRPKTEARWRKLSVMLMLGHRGPILLEDARDLADIAEASKRMIHRNKWVEEYAAEIAYNAAMSI